MIQHLIFIECLLVNLMPYSPREDTISDRAIRALRERKPGTKIGTRELAILAGAKSTQSFNNSMRLAIQNKLIVHECISPRRALWSLSDQDKEFCVDDLLVTELVDELPVRPRSTNGIKYKPRFDRREPGYRPSIEEMTIWRQNLQSYREEQTLVNRQLQLICKFRDLLGCADHIVTGDPHREIINLMSLAHQIHDARETSRFRGIEVDLLIARELRQVAEAAARARRNLELALEIMVN
jgi:hypothetical protein